MIPFGKYLRRKSNRFMVACDQEPSYTCDHSWVKISHIPSYACCHFPVSYTYTNIPYVYTCILCRITSPSSSTHRYYFFAIRLVVTLVTKLAIPGVPMETPPCSYALLGQPPWHLWTAFRLQCAPKAESAQGCCAGCRLPIVASDPVMIWRRRASMGLHKVSI